MLRKLWNDEAGFVMSAELVLILTIGVIAIIVGLSEVAVAINTELNDVSNAIGALRQAYIFTGFTGDGGKIKSFVPGSRYNDQIDDCDLNETCELVGPLPADDASEADDLTP